uniref:F5/8 type C domain-containing protein n=1 Tax=Craspedostauros australis TaxID=1486917 RepID=A0A7R9WR12_9STRA|mmetsp:Transcript_16811/g.46435  ORF Transcript_16811/g.46435 Transcript_16811/m.46435 type:complete len:155 (+) Transcript_16811:260-724(+)|eukprot:CAMPEP_0198131268 /NCGR_PEP_ID=MMETSP1442-20131203/55790_1 /TAXON_ID= /ORGANISM="Craspedostauros australis, Strain CCMP3328" /LENGTH=154 /DNA_ID=CAMNT_0043792041 /DNA_START=244 /DNA_END=708 /DNA_ORIENTATION=+
MSKTEAVLLSLTSLGTSARASSILQRNPKVNGPKHALDYEKESSCWNSDGVKSGETPKPLHFIVDFGRSVRATQIRIQFQAGFVAEEVAIEYQTESGWQTAMEEEELEDTHEMQTIDLESEVVCRAIKLNLDEFKDFYGRVTVYQLQVWGHEAE